MLLPQTGGKPKREERKKEQARKWYLAALPTCKAWKVRNSEKATQLKFCKLRESFIKYQHHNV